MSADLEGDGFSEVTTPAPQTIGSNQGPTLLTGDVLLADVNERYRDLFKEVVETLAKEETAPKDKDGNLICPDDDWEVKMTDAVKKCASLEKLLDSHRTAEIQPYETNKNVIHGRFRGLMDKLVDPRSRGTNAMKHRFERALTVYKEAKAEKERKIREAEAKRLKDIEDAKIAEANRLQKLADDAAAAAAQAELEAARKRKPEVKAAAEEAVASQRSQASIFAEQAQAAASVAQKAGDDRAKGEKQANVKSADLTRVRGQASVGSLREFVDYRDFKRAAMIQELETVCEDGGTLSSSVAIAAILPHIPDTAIEQAWRSYIRANKDRIEADVRNGKQRFRNIVTFWINKGTNVR